MKRQNTSWGVVANWYDELLTSGSDTYQEKVIQPNLLRLLSARKGMRILDLACGQGFFSRAFAKAGATVTGVDVSPELIKKAQARSSEIRYLVSSADNLKALPNGSFDPVVIVLALQNIENIAGTFSECRRVLAPGGRLLLVLNHPVLRVLKNSSWEFDADTQIQYRRLEAYMSDFATDIEMHPGKKSGKTLSFHRPLQGY